MIQFHNIVRKIFHTLTKQRDHGGSVLFYGRGACTPNNQRMFSSLTVRQLVFNKISDKLPGTMVHQSCREYAARKGTRARKAAKKGEKKMEVKTPFMFKRLQKLAELPYKNMRPLDESQLPVPEDDVYFFRKFRSQCLDFDEAVQCLRETHHPTVYNVPNAPLYLRVNLDMKYPNRPTKCMDGWKSVIEMKKPFLLEGMTRPSVLAFCIEDVDYIDKVKKEGGADLAGGKELIKAIQAGDVNAEDFEYIVAHPTVVPELTVIRGLIKKRFPTVKNRTISTDLETEIRRLKSGIKVQVTKSDREPDFAYLETPIGTLDMDGLAENFKSIMEDILPRRISGKSPQEFIISCLLKTPGNGFEELKVDLTNIFNEAENRKQMKISESTAANVQG